MQNLIKCSYINEYINFFCNVGQGHPLTFNQYSGSFNDEFDIWTVYSGERLRALLFKVVSIAQLVEVADSAVLGGVAEVVSSIPTEGHKNIFHNLPA